MKIVEINAMTVGSTGRIMLQIADAACQEGFEVYTFSTNYSRKHYKKLPPAPTGHQYYSTYPENFVHLGLGMVTGFQDCFGHFSTYRLIRKLKEIQPDIIHLHNLHGAYLNLKMLFSYIWKEHIQVVWTLHDCWSFTGQCPHFTLAKCNKWKTGCYACPQYRKYPEAYVDQTAKMWELKRKWFNMPEKMTIVTPSLWLANLVKQSFLQKHSVKVINNGIDLSKFYPRDSDFRSRYDIKAKYIVLGVSFSWGMAKGLDVFIQLSEQLNENYQIVLVGTTEETDRQLPSNIISIHKTNDQTELSEIYSAADVFVNATREENYPTVNMEAVACGTPVVTFQTGGCAETIDDTIGSVVSIDDMDAMKREVVKICEKAPYASETCVAYARNHYDMNDKFKEYVKLYETLVNERQ